MIGYAEESIETNSKGNIGFYGSYQKSTDTSGYDIEDNVITYEDKYENKSFPLTGEKKELTVVTIGVGILILLLLLLKKRKERENEK
ncbi:MAG: LPXTG cell wall anchor domain-containing protein [Enterococcus durans]